MTTDIIDRLFLELSQVTCAKTERERIAQDRVSELKEAMKPFVMLVKATNGRIPVERLSLSEWHNLVRTYDKI